MSQAGRPALPTWLKELRGTLQTGERADEPRPDDALYIPPPRQLANRPVAQEYWQVHLPLLVRYRMITEVDMAQFALLCLAFEDLVEAEEDLRTNGKVIKTENGYLVQSPYVSMRSQRWKEYVELCREFGLTPSARTRVKIQISAPGSAGGDDVGDRRQAVLDLEL
jgi:P27 family predicted phage terminase small subunit